MNLNETQHFAILQEMSGALQLCLESNNHDIVHENL